MAEAMSGASAASNDCQFDLDRSPTTSAQDVDAGAHHESACPGLEPIGIAQRRQIAPRAHEPVLDRVSREFVVPEDQSGGRVQPRDERTGQHGEGVMIASLCSLDELSLVHGPPSVCRRGDHRRARHGMSPREAKGFHPRAGTTFRWLRTAGIRSHPFGLRGSVREPGAARRRRRRAGCPSPSAGPRPSPRRTAKSCRRPDTSRGSWIRPARRRSWRALRW